MHSRRLVALLLVLALTGSALAFQQQRLYRTVSDEPEVDPEARGLVVLQQHSVFAEIIVEERSNTTTLVHFAAVVGLVKKCKQVRNVFDNAVLWFNDQFLFGNKSNVTVNVTPPGAMGENPNRTLTMGDLLDDNRNNGTGTYDPATGGSVVDEVGAGPNEGGNPDRDGFIRADSLAERWGGCFIPNGFVHAIAADDPYGLGRMAAANASAEEDVQATTTTVDEDGDKTTTDPDAAGNHGYAGAAGPNRVCVRQTNTPGTGGVQAGVCDEDLEPMSNVELVKHLIDLDIACEGCVFEYAASYFVTDPNNHRWIIDKFVYPVNMAQLAGAQFGDPTNCHVGPNPRNETLPFAGDCSLQTDQPGSYEDTPSVLQENAGVRPTTDARGDERAKFTTKEPLFTVHVQVDPWNPDRQGFADEAIWAYREDGQLRIGTPYTEDPAAATYDLCKDNAQVAGVTRYAPTAAGGGTSLKPDAYEYDETPGESGATDHNLTTAPGNGSSAWTEFRRGPVGTTVECALEYNFLIAVDFEAFDNLPPTSVQVSQSRNDVAPKPGGAWANASSQDEGTGENEIVRRAKEHGDGGRDDADPSWAGNSHPHNPADCHPPPSAPAPCSSGPKHLHDALVLDLFFYARAPYFTEQNPYWDHANETDALVTTGTPPVWDEECTTAPNLPANDYRRQAIEVRIHVRVVCDTDAMDGFHLHDGKQTIGTDPQRPGPNEARVGIDGSSATASTER